MNDQVLQAILEAHAEGLNRGVDNSDALYSRYQNGRTKTNEELRDLLTLAGLLKQVLVPLMVRPAFADQLRTDLMTAAAHTSSRRRWWWGAAAAGSIVAGAAGVWAWRRGMLSRTAAPTA